VAEARRQPREDDVSFGVSHRGSVGDAADRARAAAADSDRVRSSFGCHQQIARPNACADERLAREREDAVRSRVRVAGRAAVRQKRCPARAEASRDEARAFDPDVPAGGETRDDDRARPAAGVDGHDAPADFVRRDQLACIATEGTGSDRDATLHPWCMLRGRAHVAPAVDRIDVGGTVDARGDQQATAEAADLVERDPVGEDAGGSTAKGRAWPLVSTTTTLGGATSRA